MSSLLEKSLAVIALLARHPEGLSVSTLAGRLGQPASGVHRLLRELARLGYVRQVQAQGDYRLTIKLPAMGLGFLGRAGITDVAQPVLDRLAADSGELVRLSVADGDTLVWVAVAQGARGGLRYDPGQEQGVVAGLASSASGLAWLSSLDDDRALALAAAQQRDETGQEARPGAAPVSLTGLPQVLAEARNRGYALAVDSYIPGMAAMAVPLCPPDGGAALGCLSIAGPAVRLTPARMRDLAPLLQAAASELAEAAAGSQYFRTSRKSGKSY